MCSQLDKFLEVAAGEVGYIEGPADNETKYQKANQPWCGAFVNWVAKQAGVKIPNCIYTPAGAKAFAKAKRWQDLATAEPATFTLGVKSLTMALMGTWSRVSTGGAMRMSDRGIRMGALAVYAAPDL